LYSTAIFFAAIRAKICSAWAALADNAPPCSRRCPESARRPFEHLDAFLASNGSESCGVVITAPRHGHPLAQRQLDVAGARWHVTIRPVQPVGLAQQLLSAWVALGPRQIIASSCATRKPIDIT
jgi:hypothetical protein